jgi:hypothetical protein
MTVQLQLHFPATADTPIHRERDRPKSISIKGWGQFIDDVCVRGGLKLTHEALLRVLHREPKFKHITSIKDLTNVHLVKIEFFMQTCPWLGES